MPLLLSDAIYSHLLTFIVAGIGIAVDLVLIIFIAINKPKEKSSWYLIGWILFIGIFDEFFSILVMSTTDKTVALNIYREGSFTILFIPFFYLFVREYLKITKDILIRIAAYTYSILVTGAMFLYPTSLIKDIVWDPNVNFFIPVYNDKLIPFYYIGLVIWAFGIYQVIKSYRSSKSIISKNKLKYIIFGSIAPLLGLIAVSIPIIAIRRYPLDMFAITIGAIMLVYGVIRYQALDINIIIRKGLVYSLLTFFVTTIYLVLAYVVQILIGVSQKPMSIPAVIVTAIVIALVFQPLQNITQTIIDKLFFRSPYDKQTLISNFSKAMSSEINMKKLCGSILEIVCSEMKISNGIIYVNTDKQLEMVQTYGYAIPPNVIVGLSHPTISKLHENQGIISLYDIQDNLDKNLLMELQVELLLPMFSNGKFAGMIGLGHKKSDEAYTMDEYNLLSIFTDQAAVALNNATLFEEVKKDKEKVERLLAQEREVDRSKSEFMLITSHNLRTPLTVIKGYLDYFIRKKDTYDKTDQNYIDILSKSVEKLSVLTEALLMTSLIEKGNLRLQKEPVEMGELLNDIYEEYLPKATGKKLYLRLNIPAETHPPVDIDRNNIRYAISNLVDNAIKFTSQGGVTINLTYTPDYFVVEIQDTGAGIPKEEVPKLFVKFHQVRTTNYEDVPGLGMGLYIVKLIIDSHAGKVWVNSTMNKGSTFSMLLPYV